MARGSIIFREATNMWENGKIEKNMVKGYTSFQKETGLKGNGSMMKYTVKVLMFIPVERDSQENGRTGINISMVG